MSRLVIASNRVWPARGEALAGGLAVAITDVLQDRGGLWFGWSSKISEKPAREARVEQRGRLTIADIDLTPAEYEGYYNGYSNQCLWPLCHFRLDLMNYDAPSEAAYRGVNYRMAAALLPLLREDDLIWIHDYHLIPLAAMLRSMGCRQRMGFFLHVPFPPPDLLATLPHHRAFIHNFNAYDLIGMQTDADLGRLLACLEQERSAGAGAEGAEAFDARTRLGCFPVGIDAARFRDLAASTRGIREAEHMRNALQGRDQIISVDRLDYSKGLLRRIGAIEALLADRADLHGQIEFLQIAPVSRSELQDYQNFRRDLELAAARVNGRYSRADWTPIRYLNRALPRGKLAGLYRASRIGLVTPMRDGMNLVCKEYVAAQDPVAPGVLVLSCFAGAAHSMPAALIVNPYDAAGVASAIGQATKMGLQERCNRHTELMEEVSSRDSANWARTFIETLARTECSPRHA